jgi:hypothetical protein
MRLSSGFTCSAQAKLGLSAWSMAAAEKPPAA